MHPNIGIIMGTKIFVNFTRYEYDECIRRLNNEIQPLLKATRKSSAQPAQPNAEIRAEVDTSTKDSGRTDEAKDAAADSGIYEASSWDAGEVQSWLAEAGVHPLIRDHLNNCHGGHLHELFEMKLKAADYFFCFIGSCAAASGRACSLKDILAFAFHLDELFVAY
jgi:hypothetical protein